jgi:hypothetical protein
MCLDNKKLLSLETVMATNPWMYSRTQKKQHEKKHLDSREIVNSFKNDIWTVEKLSAFKKMASGQS